MLKSSFMNFDKILKLAAKGDLPGVQKILKENPTLLNKPSGGHNRTLLWEAVNGNRIDLVEYLIDAGADVNIPGRYRNETFVLLKPYNIAHRKKKEELKAYLLSKGHEMDVFSLSYSGTATELATKIKKDKNLIHQEQPEDILWKVTPLHFALAGENKAVLIKLLELGAKVEPYSKLLYEIACRNNRLDLIKLLTKYGGDPSQAEVPSVFYHTNVEVIAYFMNQGLDADKPFVHGWPPIAYLSRGDKGEHPEKIKELLKYIKDINAKTPKGISALHACTKAGFLRVLKVLLNAGADINIRDNSGRTPLYYSRKYKRKLLEECLLENGGIE
ncbi:MAG: hypothetical protein Sapg2KO_43170 [Saprospiraceae bacterium]